MSDMKTRFCKLRHKLKITKKPLISYFVFITLLITVPSLMLKYLHSREYLKN